jgi:IclR family KDG regulon transcriptional repressor
MTLQSLQKAIRVLNAFKKNPELGVTEISKMLSLNKSNVHNILSTFESMGYMEQNKQSQKYRLSFGILELSYALLSRIGIRNVAYPYMKQLASTTGEHIYLAIPYGSQALYLEAASPAHLTYERSLSGETAPLYCTGIGKVMLAHIPEENLYRHLPESLIAYTEHTITDREALKKELQIIRQQGYSVDNMEHEFGIMCVGVPVLDERGLPLAGISISGPSLRFSQEKLPEYARMLRQLLEKLEPVLLSLLDQYR